MENRQKYNPQVHRRRSIRLREYDYSQNGLYFITICCQNKECLFGAIGNGLMAKSNAGKIADQCWNAIPAHFPNAILHEYVIMPNHIHGIIELLQAESTPRVGAENFLPLPQKQNEFQKPIPLSIASIVKGFKIGVTKWFRANTEIDTVWQRNYYEHIIRNQESFQNISSYIINNPENWQQDKFYK